jgi:ubiquinone biosynthesis protein COQ4
MDRIMVSADSSQVDASRSLIAEPVEAPFFFGRPGSDEGGTLDPNVLVRHRAGRAELLPIVHPDRRRPSFQPIKAVNHFRAAIRDKENTAELIGVFDSLPWREVGEAASAFLSSERGRRIYESEPFLPEIFDDHATLRRTPKGSFAHAYCDFMESEGLSAAGMVEASGDTRNGLPMLPDGVEWYGDRLRDTHDILHVLTGYGRDPLGEQCVLAYLFHQRPSLGHLAVSWSATLLMKAKSKGKAPIIGAVIEAHRHGRLAPRIVEQPIRELLALPLTEVRQRMNVRHPARYEAVHRIWREEGVDAHAFFAKQPA